MKRKAVQFVDNVLDDPGRSAEIEEESVADYADRKKITIENPRGGVTTVDSTMTKAELEEVVDQSLETLEDALDPKLTREELVEKVEEAYDLLAGEEDDEPDGGEEEED